MTIQEFSEELQSLYKRAYDEFYDKELYLTTISFDEYYK